MSSAAGLWKLFRDQAERGSGIGLKLFGFIAESSFIIIPESCSGSPRNTVLNHPGIAFTFDRIPHPSAVTPNGVLPSTHLCLMASCSETCSTCDALRRRCRLRTDD